jgi:type I restriction enzyme S subunit
MSWPTVTLAEITDIISGGTPKSGVAEFWEGDVEWITPKDMGKMTGIYASDTSRKITNLGLSKSSSKLIAQNSVILSTRAPIGHLVINTVPMATNQGCRGLVPKDNLDTKYLFYFLFDSVDLLNDLGSGTTFKELSKGALEKVGVPLPPIAEQKRIVALLDTVFTDLEQTRAKTEQNLKNSRELFDSYLQQLFSQRGEGWVEKNLEELVTEDCSLSYGIVVSVVTTTHGVIFSIDK